MKLKEIMTRDVEVVSPTDSLWTAAKKMRDRDIGFLPVMDGERLLGVISDRDIIIRVLAEGKPVDGLVSENLVSRPVICCYEDDNVSDAARLMQENQIRRLVVLSRGEKHLVGVVSLGDLASNMSGRTSGEVLQDISEPVSVD